MQPAQPAQPTIPEFTLVKRTDWYYLQLTSMLDLKQTRFVVLKSDDPRAERVGNYALFFIEGMTYFSSSDWFQDVCTVPAQPTHPIDLGLHVLSVVRKYGERVIATGHRLNISVRLGNALLDTIESIEEAKIAWFGEIDLYPGKDQYHKKNPERNRKNSAVVTQDKKIFIKTYNCISESHKRVMIIYELTKKEIFTTHKLIKEGLSPTVLEGLVRKFNREQEICTNLLKATTPGYTYDLTNILVPDRVLEYDHNATTKKKIIFPFRTHDLSTFAQTVQIPDEMLKKMALEMIRGVNNFHKLFPNYCHGDIKLNNFLIQMPGYKIYLMDFGIIYRTQIKAVEVLGTSTYQPLEAFDGFPKIIDMKKWCAWTLGRTLAYLLEPWTREFPSATKDQVINFQKEFHNRPMRIKEFEPIVKGLLKDRPGDRITIDQALSMAIQISTPPENPSPMLPSCIGAS